MRLIILVEGIARYLLESALGNAPKGQIASRCGYIVTDGVKLRTTLLMLRLRHLIFTVKQNHEQLAEECLVVGFTGPPSQPRWLSPEDSMLLLERANAVSTVPKMIQQEEVSELLSSLDEIQEHLNDFAEEIAQDLMESHKRVRKITKEGAVRVTPQLPADILGVYILQPGKRS